MIKEVVQVWLVFFAAGALGWGCVGWYLDREEGQVLEGKKDYRTTVLPVVNYEKDSAR